MKFNFQKNYANIAQLLLFFILAFGLQYQAIINFSKAGLRVCIGDLPVIVLAILLFINLLRQPRLSRWKAIGLLPALAAATAVMAVSLLIFWHSFGHFSPWGLVNRFLGWFILMAYLAAGIAAGSLWGDQGRRRIVIILSSAIVGLAAVSGLMSFTFYWVELIPIEFRAIPLRGFVHNRNAFSFLLVAATCMLVTDHLRPKPLFHDRWVALALGVLGLCLLYAGSRAAMPLGACILLAGWYWGRLPARTIVHGFVVGVAIMGGIVAIRYALNLLSFRSGMLPPLYVAHYSESPDYASLATNSSDYERLTSFAQAFEMWLHSPWFGTGLGSFLEQQIASTGYPLIIHNTALWMLTELGVVGVLAFGVLIAIIFRGLWRRDALTDPALRLTGLLLLGTFVALSMVHDVMYQRILWLVIGLALAVPSRTDAAPCAE